MNLDEKLKELAKQREIAQMQKTAMDYLVKAAKASPDYTDAEQMAQKANEEITRLENEIKGYALAVYSETTEKNVHPSVSVKIFNTFKIVDLAKVREFVDARLRDALVVDEGKVKKYALEIGPVEGTEVGQEARVQIASNL